MPDNLFEKLDQQSAQIEDLQKGQVEILALLQQQIGAPANPNAAPLNAQTQRANEQQVLERFLRASKKSYHFFGGSNDYKSEKNKTVLFLSLTVAVALIENILTSAAAGLFSTFSLIEDLWFFLVFRMICHVLRSQRFYDHLDYSGHSFMTFAQNNNGLFYPDKIKTSYKILKVLALISAPCNIIFLFARYHGAVTIFAVVFEALVFAAVFLSQFIAEGFFCQYSLVYYCGKTENGNNEVTLVWDQTFRKWHTQEEYESKFPFAK